MIIWVCDSTLKIIANSAKEAQDPNLTNGKVGGFDCCARSWPNIFAIC
jgi:hypothetical protein